jgi:hypothetical protein
VNKAITAATQDLAKRAYWAEKMVALQDFVRRMQNDPDRRRDLSTGVIMDRLASLASLTGSDFKKYLCPTEAATELVDNIVNYANARYDEAVAEVARLAKEHTDVMGVTEQNE